MRSFAIIAICLALSTGLGSCDKVNDVLTSYFRVTIDGTAWTAGATTGTALAGRLTIAGSSLTGGRIVNLLVPADIQPGEYSLDAIGAYTAQYKPDGVNIYTATSGTLTITRHDVATKEIVGTFSFDALNVGGNTAALTSGSFSVSYF